MTLLRAELRKTFSTKLWWALLIPAAVLAILINLFAGAFANGLPGGATILLGSLAYALGLTTVFATVHGIVAMSAEFRHRTITTTYLTSGARSGVLLAKTAACALVGALYGVVTVLVGTAAGVLGRTGGAFPPVGPLLALLGIGVLVTVLWSAVGTALGTVITNQAVVLVVVLLYLLLGELLLTALLNASGNVTLGLLASYLPGNASDIALDDLPTRIIAGDAGAAALGAGSRPPWWGALLVLAAWTGAATATAWVVGGRRDIT
ncbi:ABC transporter permease [Pseudonocardia sp. GCM10023141]|uniref:ABC transporter permease n=1 Tax=Pseudonocardia sp. GCM10023141 TaxID=3252653 RepID=UPI00360EF6E3